MRLNLALVRELANHLDRDDIHEIIRLAKAVDDIDAKWNRKLRIMWTHIRATAIDSLEEHGRITKFAQEDIQDLLEEFYVEHAFYTMIHAFKSTRSTGKGGKRLAAPPKGPMPRSLKELRVLWDMWRKKKVVPKRQAAIVDKVKKAFVNKCQTSWVKYSDDYRRGTSGDKLDIVRRMQEAADTEFSRSKMIVETETTRYWNQTRREVYDEAEDVTHYLFVPIRDMATTKWCSSRRRLVYAKGDPLLDKETPPIHWNCRSELLPLTIMNPRHRAMIEDKSMWRRNHKCEPLPPGWNS